MKTIREKSFKRVLYPGSFDPFTNGHLDLVLRGVKLFDEVLVAVAINRDKNPLFSVEERVELIRKCVKDIPKVKVVKFTGLLVEAIALFDAQAVLRGVRAFSDFEYELQMALMNRSLKSECETIFMMPTVHNSFVSSRMVREVAFLGGDYAQYVPAEVKEAIATKLS